VETGEKMEHYWVGRRERMAMSTIQVDVPDEVLISLKETSQTLARELRVAAAVKLFELGKLSSGRAAQLAGMSRVEFLLALGRYQVGWTPFFDSFRARIS
jgi:predicted HTH domain antitoxin